MIPDLEGQLAELRPGNHLCMLFDSDAERLGALVPYLRDGLARGERCLYAFGEQGTEPLSAPSPPSAWISARSASAARCVL